MGKLFYSQVVPRSLHLKDRQRVAKQIIRCIYYSRHPELDSGSSLSRNWDSGSEAGMTLRKSTVLDLACGNGAISYLLAPYIKEIIGIDEDQLAIGDGKKKFHARNLMLKVASAENIPYKANSFDMVIFRRSYQYMQNLEKVALEIYRVLKPSGVCYFEASNTLSFVKRDYHPIFYKTFWQLQSIFRNFHITNLTPLILKNPQKYAFSKLYSRRNILKIIPLSVLRFVEPFYPDFIWILRKI